VVPIIVGDPNNIIIQTTMRIGVFLPKGEPFSMRICRESITRELNSRGIKVVLKSEIKDVLDGIDLFWDHCAAGGRPPRRWLWKNEKPSVVTLHGARPLVLTANEYWSGKKAQLKGRIHNFKKLITWTLIDKTKFSFIAVSQHTKNEFLRIFRIPEFQITVIHNGLNHEIFFPADESNQTHDPYLFHISQYQPVKNIDRMIAGYSHIPSNIRPRFIIIASGYNRLAPKFSEGLEIHNEPISEDDLVRLYRGAIGFVFPSLHEGFGMPILEAMACGCPVITSNVTACPEVAGDAALLVNPRSVSDITSAILRLITESDLRSYLREKGLKRASEFTWRSSAEEHIRVFEKVLAKSRT